MAVLGLKERYRLLVAAMAPAERARHIEEVSHFMAEKKQPRIVNERFLRKTVPMGINLSDSSASIGRN